jgi:hypothetical protein
MAIWVGLRNWVTRSLYMLEVVCELCAPKSLEGSRADDGDYVGLVIYAVDDRQQEGLRSIRSVLVAY